MEPEIIFTSIILASLISLLFIIIINFKNCHEDIKKINFKNIIIQLLSLTVWITIFFNIIFSDNSKYTYLSFFLFLASLVIGLLLIKNIFKESEVKKTLEELIEKIKENNKKLILLDKQKTEFVSLASHQLRGPLSVIQGYISMILDQDYGEVPVQMRDPLERSLRSSKALGLLISDYLDVAQIEKGQMEYVFEKFNLSELLEEITSEFRLVSEKAGLDFEFNKNEQEIFIKADKNKIRQIISNIIDNAIKYTPKGSVKISIQKDNHKTIIKVTDTGIGIEKEKVKEIFNKFARTSQAIKMNVTGTGLGLFVAKIMTEAQDGKIWVKSDGLNKGSTFYVSLPIAKED